MNVVSKINWRGSFRQVDDFPLWGQHKDAIFEKIDFKRFVKLLARLFRKFSLPFLQFFHPRDFIRVCGYTCFRFSRFFPNPMSRDAVFGFLVHFSRADLKFNYFIVNREYGRMKRAIAVWFRERNIVFNPPRNRFPERMDNAEHLIAFFDRVYRDAKRGKVCDAREVQILAEKFFPKTVIMLCAKINYKILYASFFKFRCNNRPDALQICLSLGEQFFYFLENPRVFFRILWRRSVSFTRTTRTSSATARNIFRVDSTVRSNPWYRTRSSLVSASTRNVTSLPTFFWRSSLVIKVELSRTSCKSAADTVWASSLSLMISWATAIGCVMYGWPDSRFCPLWHSSAMRNACRISSCSFGE